MRKKFMAVLAGLAVAASVGPLTAPAHAADCYGSPSFDDTYVCIVRIDPPSVSFPPGPQVLVPAICLGEDLGCPVEESYVPLPDVLVDGGTVGLFHNGTCYYVQDGFATSVEADSADDCP